MIRLDRQYLEGIDWTLVALGVGISLVGILTIYSATRPIVGNDWPGFHVRQFYWLMLGLAFMAGAAVFDYRYLRKGALGIYIICALLLLAVLVKGRTGMGAQRWLELGPVGFQPSEVFKLAFLMVLARHLDDDREALGLGGVALAFGLYAAVPLALILKQPDLGTSVVVMGLFGLLVLSRGIQRRVLLLAIMVSLVSVPFLGTIAWDGLKDYQKKRIVAFINPDIDPGGIGYHVNQSKVAIGSGGGFGKGFMKGTQGPLRFLPEKHTDFVFAIFAEEWGFAGSAVLLALYVMMILRGMETAWGAPDRFGRYLALGITYMFLIYFFVNVGMTLGIMPVVGVPLPFMSYGGTALVINFTALGILLSIGARRRKPRY